jgi:Fic family protein
MVADLQAHRWDPISDLPSDWHDLRRTDLDVVQGQWREEKAIIKDPAKIEKLEDRLGTEWAIETGIIERLYTIDRGITETLIELGLEGLYQFHERGRVSQDALRLIQDQREALEFVFQFIKQERQLTLSYIKELHQLLTRHQETSEGVDQFGNKTRVPLLKGTWKTLPNNPTLPDGRVHEYCPPDFVQDEMEQLLQWHEDHEQAGVDAEIEAAWLHHRFTQIHPFQDGNGRVARALSTMVFMRRDYLPLVIRDTQHRERYLDALEVADGGDLSGLVDLFADIQIQDLSNAIETVRELKGEGITRIASSAAERVKIKQQAAEEETRLLTDRLLQIAETRLEEAKSELELSFSRQGVSIDADVRKNLPETATWWTYQIVDTARHYGYRADLNRGRQWVQLRLRLDQFGRVQTNVIISFHHNATVPGLMVASAFLSTSAPEAPAEGPREAFREELEIAAAGDQPFTYSASHRDPETPFRVWLDEALESALDKWQSRI